MTRQIDHLPPHDVAAEEAVIAALLLDDEAVLRVVGLGLQPADFFREAHGWCYEAAIAISERGETVTVPSLAHELERAGRLDKAGGEPWIVEIAGKYFTAVGVEGHARIVMRDALYRRLISAAGSVARIAYEGGPDFQSVLDRAESEVRSVAAQTGNVGVVSARSLLEESVDRALITTGYPSLDWAIRGFARGEIAIVGARTNHGKTALMAGMALRDALQGLTVGYFPVEGTGRAILARMASDLTGVSPGWASRHGWPHGAHDEFQAQLQMLADFESLWFPDEKHKPTTAHGIGSWLTRAARLNGIDIAFVDHIDQMTHEGERGQTEASAIAASMQTFVDIANREGIAIVIGSQVNNESAKSDQIAPSLIGLHGAGAKAQKAQTVLMVGLLDPQKHDFAEAKNAELRNAGLAPAGGQWMEVRVEKVKDYLERPEVLTRDGESWAFYLDRRSGAVRDLGEQRG